MRSAPRFRFPTSRIARVLYAAAIVTSISLVSIFHGKPRVWAVDEVPVAFWAWRTQGPDQTDIRAAMDKTKAQVVFLRAGQIDLQDGKLRRIRPLTGSFPQRVKLHLVYNTTRAVLEQLESIDPQILASEFAGDYRADLERTRRDGADVRGLQLDIDFPTRLLPRYEQTLNALRKELKPGNELSITGLPTWMESPALTDVLRNIDFWVPQFYGAEIPTHFSQTVPISSPQNITYFVNKARQLDKPFYAGLAAYSVALLYSSGGSLITMRGDMNLTLIAANPNLELIDQRSFDSAERRYAFRAKADGVIEALNMRAGDVLVVELPSAETLRIAARITRELAGKRLLGVCVFRLPVSDDPATLNLDQVTTALYDQPSVAAIDVRIRQAAESDSTHGLILECANTGTTSPVVGSLKIDLTAPSGSFTAVSPTPGVSIQSMCVSERRDGPQPCSEHRANLLRLTIQFLPPGQTLSAGVTLSTPPVTTPVRITMKTDADQTYSVQREVSIEAGVK